MHLFRARSHLSKWQPFDRTSIAPGHAFQNGSHLNPPLLIVSGHAFQNAHSNAPQVMLFKILAI
jgi:hypothetical protein